MSKESGRLRRLADCLVKSDWRVSIGHSAEQAPILFLESEQDQFDIRVSTARLCESRDAR